MNKITGKTDRSNTHDGTILLRSVSVMKFVSASVHKMTFRNSDWSEPLRERGPYRRVELDEDDWRDMGRPDTITVTIEPGDLLDAEDR